MSSRIAGHLRSNVVGYVAVFIALSGTAYAVDGPLPGQNQVGSEDIINNDILSKDIANGRIFNVDLADNVFTGQKVKDGTLTGADVADDSLTGADIKESTLTLPSRYAYVYNLAPRVVPIEADVVFDTNGPLTSGIAHDPGTPQITLASAGAYKVTFSVTGVEANQMALFVNGGQVPGSIYGSGTGTQQNTGQVIFTVGAGAVLTLRNHASASAVTLQSLAGGTQTNTNASIVIEKLN